jgi:hypothetical protein
MGNTVYVVRDLGAVVQMFLFMNECVIVNTGVILCCSCSLGAVLHVFLLLHECVIVYTGVILCCSCLLGAVLHNENICTTFLNHEQHRLTPE